MNSSNLDPQIAQLEAGHPVYNPGYWCRLPRARQRCPISGLSRSTMVELVRPGPRNDYRPPVASRVLKHKGASRGIVLINSQSLLAYIEGLPSPVRGENEESA
jgi:hypothetical protein